MYYNLFNGGGYHAECKCLYERSDGKRKTGEPQLSCGIVGLCH